MEIKPSVQLVVLTQVECAETRAEKPQRVSPRALRRDDPEAVWWARGFERVAEKFALTARQRAVLFLVVVGLTNEEIATELAISKHTVKTHMEHVLHRTEAANRRELCTLVFGSTGEA